MTRREQQEDAYLPPMRLVLRWSVLLLVCGRHAQAQDWRPGDTIDLIRRAIAHRASRDADTLLTAWHAEAHGILRYASVLDHGDGPVERVVRADELRIEVYGESPNLSKQIIRAWRDTSFLPNRVSYHRDHLGIVANDFGPAIRLGQGDEVRDVPHPLSDAGLARYLFALGDTVTLNGPQGRVLVVAVQVRPTSPDSAGTVGTLYLDLARAALVRFRFTFTPVSYRDGTVEEITVTLENALQDFTRWLPWRQSIMIRRGLPLFDLPFRTVIRGDWTIDKYELGVHRPSDWFAGAFLVGPRTPMRGGMWDAPLAAQLVALPATDADVAMIAREASSALGGALLDGLPHLRFSGTGISDFIRINRVEGVTPAIGTRLALGALFVARGRIGIGLSDHRIVGSASLERRLGAGTLSLNAARSVRDIGDRPVISGLGNSLRAAVSGDDYGDYSLVDRFGLQYSTMLAGFRVVASVAGESYASVVTTFRPISGTATPNPALGGGDQIVLHVTLSRRDSHGDGISLDHEAAAAWQRVSGSARGRVAMPVGNLVLSAMAGIGSGELPGYRSFVLGGRGTLLGVPFRALGGRRIALVEAAWAIPVALPTPPFPYARWIRLPSVFSPYLGAGVAGGEMPDLPWRATGRIEPIAGLRFDLWGPLLRLDAGMSLRTGRVGVAIDIHPDWWGLF